MPRMTQGPADRSRIDLNDPLSVRWWCKELQVSAGDLRMLVAEVGPRPEAVREQVAKTRAAAV